MWEQKIWKWMNRCRQKLEQLMGWLVPSQVHYINGPDTLPAPLSQEEEAEIMERIERGDAAAREDVYKRQALISATVPAQTTCPP